MKLRSSSLWVRGNWVIIEYEFSPKNSPILPIVNITEYINSEQVCLTYTNLFSIFQDDDMIPEPEQTMLEGSDEEDPE